MPTEAEVQTQWKNLVNVLEKSRAYFDDDLVDPGGYIDVFVQSLEGEYLSISGPSVVSRIRALCSSAVDANQAFAALEPVLLEYGLILAASATLGYGSGFSSAADVFPALYQWLHDNSATVATRNITYASVSANGSNTGNAIVSRLTADRHGYSLEACHVEKKMFKCVQDQNSGTQKWAESFEAIGEAASFDGLNIGITGSGEAARTLIRAKHAGSGAGGSLLNNSSFSDFDSTASSEKFANWTESLGGGAVIGDVTQDTTNYYRSHPNASTNASLKISMDNASDSIALKQTLSQMRVSRLDPNTPYFLRAMWNRSIGSGTGGTVALKLGGNTAVSTSVASQSGWQELVIPFNSTCWLDNFGEDDLDIEIGWNNGTSGYILFDDLILCPWDLIDGTYWLLRHNAGTPTANLVDDEYYAVDSGGAPGTGILQYWCWRSGLGYLPSSGTPTISDPS